MMVDEADIDPMGAVRGAGGGGAGGKRGAESPRAAPPKRKAGPLPQHVVARRPSSPAPPASPASPAPPPPAAPHPAAPYALPLPLAFGPPPPAAPLSPLSPHSPVTARRPASPLAPVPSDLPSGRPPEVSLYTSLSTVSYASYVLAGDFTSFFICFPGAAQHGHGRTDHHITSSAFTACYAYFTACYQTIP